MLVNLFKSIFTSLLFSGFVIALISCGESPNPQLPGGAQSITASGLSFLPRRPFARAWDTLAVKVTYNPIYDCSNLKELKLVESGDTITAEVEVILPTDINACALINSTGRDTILYWDAGPPGQVWHLKSTDSIAGDSIIVISNTFQDTLLNIYAGRDSLLPLPVDSVMFTLESCQALNYAYYCSSSTGDTLYILAQIFYMPLNCQRQVSFFPDLQYLYAVSGYEGACVLYLRDSLKNNQDLF
jgi:hypothetical protein